MNRRERRRFTKQVALRAREKTIYGYEVFQWLRAIYRISTPNVIDIVAIGPRRTIYAETFRWVKRQVGE